MFLHAVASYAGGAVVGHVTPEVTCGSGIACGRRVVLGDALEAYVLRYLRVGVEVVEEGSIERLHSADHGLMTVFLGGLEIAAVSEERVGIRQHFRHATVLRIEHALHLLRGELGNDVHGPVAELAVQRLRRAVAGIDGCVAQTCHHLVFAIERHPAPHLVIGRQVSFVELLPYLVDGLSANISFQSGIVVVESVLTILQHSDHLVESRLELLTGAVVMAGGISQRQG